MVMFDDNKRKAEEVDLRVDVWKRVKASAKTQAANQPRAAKRQGSKKLKLEAEKQQLQEDNRLLANSLHRWTVVPISSGQIETQAYWGRTTWLWRCQHLSSWKTQGPVQGAWLWRCQHLSPWAAAQ